jgi:hypothetical protein
VFWGGQSGWQRQTQPDNSPSHPRATREPFVECVGLTLRLS